MTRRYPVAGPSITEREIARVTEAVRSCWYGKHGVMHERFERAFAEAIGVGHAIATPSCTSALHLALAALGVGPGDEVIVPDCTWIASVAPVRYVGATPVFADISADSWCLEADTVAACITGKTRAVIAVDLYGSMPDYDALQALCDAHGLALIEDAAESFGSTQRGRWAGSFGDAAAFSFHGSKTLTTGEGGMFVTSCDATAARVRVLRDHGRAPGDRWFENQEVAFKYKMSAMQAALGLAQLERAQELIDKKHALKRSYTDAFGPHTAIQLNPVLPHTHATPWMTTMVWPAAWDVTKAEMHAALDARGVDTRPFFHPLSSLPAFAESPKATAARWRNKTAYDISSRGLNLPSAHCLDARAVATIAGHVADAFGTLRGEAKRGRSAA